MTIKTAADLDESRAKTIHGADGLEALTDWSKLRFAQTSGYELVAQDIRCHDEAHGIPTEALLAVMRGEAVILPIEPDAWMKVQGEEGLESMSFLELWRRVLAASPWAKKESDNV